MRSKIGQGNVLIAIVILFVALAGCTAAPTSAPAAGANPASAPQGELKGTISVSGAFALYPMMQKWAEEFQKLNPGVEFDISAGGAGKGMTDALSGAVDIGMISREISKDEEAKGAFWVAVTKDAVFVVANAKNPVAQELAARGIDQKTFQKIYISGELATWGAVVGKPEIKDEIHVFTRSDASGAGDTWAKFLGKAQQDLKGIGVSGDPGLLDAVVKDPLGIGYNNLNYAFDTTTGAVVSGAMIVPIDNNANGKADADEIIASKQAAVDAVMSGKYPSPPARLLYLATKGKPGPLPLAFIRWILGDGQKLLLPTGFIPLTPEQQTESQTRVR